MDCPALQVRLQIWRVGRVQSSVWPVGVVGKGLLALMGSRTRSHSTFQAMTPSIIVGLSLFPA